MRTTYQNPRGTRRESRTLSGRVRGGKLYPVMAQAFLGSESGVVSQDIIVELEPIAGRMLTPIKLEVVSVYAPALACHALKNAGGQYPGSADVYREELLSGAPVFDLENADENELPQRMGVEPVSIAGVQKVNEIVRLAHNASINYLRQRKYVKADLLTASNMSVTPALFAQSALDLLNGVLDPEDRVNGKINFQGQIPVKGIRRSGGNGPSEDGWNIPAAETFQVGGAKNLQFDIDKDGVSSIYGDLDGTQTISLQDFYLKQKEDSLVRQMRQMVDDNPEDGEEQIRRWAHGLSIEPGKMPYVVYEKEHVFGTSMQSAMDGPSLDQRQTNSVASVNFTVPIAPNEFGGLLITFIAIKPDETMEHQPHPILSEPWGAINFVADEMALDPVPVTNRQLFADIPAGDEETIAMYCGNNELKFNYVNYGFTRNTDVTTVENKTALWQVQVPMSLTPAGILYPEDLNHYPFSLNAATDDVATYRIGHRARINTPLIKGPTPVEELADIETADIFEDA
ncbi:hypothetical protein [Tritonibacter mobilis]|uniref:hypothetical protein n=1 Tax=Tritonibacter mobilis TaxID=379347 RepID=UPI001401ECE8|nr:hypothetical protein [Tritonibacter mobilis]NHM20313.1 hypothetical protein [Tritonibacter mobilis]NHM24477.1 hypothetical protein [Tritonibacter mobilis]